MSRFVPSVRRIALALLVLVTVTAAGGAVADEVRFVRLHTAEGPILVALFPDLAPYHAANFEHLAASGFYEGTRFHRIVPGFVIQGGDPNSKDRDPRNDGQGGPTIADVLTADELEQVVAAGSVLEAKGYTGLSLDSRASLRAEFSPTAKHLRGTLSMARAGDPDSAGSQFFICVDVTASLDRQYSVFGHVVSGMDAVDAIVSAPLDGSPRSQRPANPVAIDRCEIVGDRGGLSAEEELLYQEMRQSLLDAGSKW